MCSIPLRCNTLRRRSPHGRTIVYTNTATAGSDTSTLTLTITGSNDAPTISSTSVPLSGTEDTAYVFSWAQFGIADVDTSNTLYVQINALPTDGKLQYYNGTSWTDVTAGRTLPGSGRLWPPALRA